MGDQAPTGIGKSYYTQPPYLPLSSPTILVGPHGDPHHSHPIGVARLTRLTTNSLSLSLSPFSYYKSLGLPPLSSPGDAEKAAEPNRRRREQWHRRTRTETAGTRKSATRAFFRAMSSIRYISLFLRSSSLPASLLRS